MRVVFCVFICLTHWDCGHFGGGYLGVDFFFIISGYYLMEGFERRREALVGQDAYKSSLSYLFSRIRRFLPDYLFAHIIMLIVRVFILHQKSFHEYLLTAFWEVTFLQNIGLTASGQLLNGVTWFLSATLIVSYIIYLLLQKKYELYLYVIAPFSVMISFCYFNQRFGHIGVASQVMTFTSTGIVLGFATMSLGCITYKMVESFQRAEIKWNRCLQLMQTLLEAGLLALTAVICYREGKTQKDFVIVVFCAILIASASTGRSLIAALFNRGIFRTVFTRLGELSYVIFLNHFMILCVLKSLFDIGEEMYLRYVVLFLSITVVYSLFADAAVRKGMKVIKKLAQEHGCAAG